MVMNDNMGSGALHKLHNQILVAIVCTERGSTGLENIPKNNFLTASLMELIISSEFLFKIEII